MEILQACNTCFVLFEMMPLLLGKDLLSPHKVFSLVYLWLESQDLFEACKPLADFVRVPNTYDTLMAGNVIPGSGMLVPGMLFQQEIHLEPIYGTSGTAPSLDGTKSAEGQYNTNHGCSFSYFGCESPHQGAPTARQYGKCKTQRPRTAVQPLTSKISTYFTRKNYALNKIIFLKFLAKGFTIRADIRPKCAHFQPPS